MAEVILMPRLSDTMTEGVIAAWHKKVGDPVKKGELLAEVETDKATMDLESYKDGTLLYTGTEKGGKIQVNDLLAIIGAPGEDISSLVKGKGQAAPASTASSAPAPTAAPVAKSANRSSQTAPAANNLAASQAAPAGASATIPGLDLSKQEEVILMPRLSDTMTEGVIADWHKNVGDAVRKGDILADIETDKATMELESYKEGKLLYVGAKKGQKIAVNDLLAIIGDEKKVDLEKILAAAKNKTAAGSATAGVAAGSGASNSAVSNSAVSNSAAPGSAAPGSGTQAASAPSGGADQHSGLSVTADGRIKASPLAKRMAAEKGI